MALECVGCDVAVVDGGVCVVAGLARVVVGGGEAALVCVFLLREIGFTVCEGSEMWGWFTVSARELARTLACGASHYLSCCFAANTNVETGHLEHAPRSMWNG